MNSQIPASRKKGAAIKKDNEKLTYSPLEIANGIVSVLLVTISTLFWFWVLMFVAILKLIIPLKPWQNFCSRILVMIAETWLSINNFIIKITKSIEWDVAGTDNLPSDQWYLVISNHQSWSDIVILQKIFNRKIPFLKFFLKKELIKVPLLGIAWWALDYPFMKRYSSSFLERNPHLKGKDMEITRKACEKFKTKPVSIMNFVEGTRFTQEKHDKQKSPYRNLLLPRAGGVGFVISAMGELLTGILNVTIYYPEGNKTFWAFLCGKVKKIVVRVEKIPLNDTIIGDYAGNADFRNNFQGWLNDLWKEKDRKLDNLNKTI